MKKIFIILMVFTLMLTIVGCGAEDNKPANTDPTRAPDIIDESDVFAFDRIVRISDDETKTIRIYPSTWRNVEVVETSNSSSKNTADTIWFIDWKDGVRILTDKNSYELNIKSDDFSEDHAIYDVYGGESLDTTTNTLGIDVDAMLSAINDRTIVKADFIRGTEKYTTAANTEITVYYNELHQSISAFDTIYDPKTYTQDDFLEIAADTLSWNDDIIDAMCNLIGIDRDEIYVHRSITAYYDKGFNTGAIRSQVLDTLHWDGNKTSCDILLYSFDGVYYIQEGYFHVVFSEDGADIKTIVWTGQKGLYN